MKQLFMMTALVGAMAWAGGLYLEIGNPSANAEAKAMNALLVARVTACHEPAKSAVTATLVEAQGGEMKRSELRVVALKTPGMFAVLGSAPKGSVIDLAVTNPQFDNYRPRVLVHSDGDGVRVAGAKRFFSTPPADAEIKSFLGY